MSENRPEISAILISYNGMTYLPDCLETLTDDLSDLSHELIVIDNNSTDGSHEFISSNYPDSNLIANSKNLGFAKAVNQGIKMAQGEYLYILNQDLRFDKGTAITLLGRLKQDPKIGMIGPKFVRFDRSLHHSARALPSYRHIFYRLFLLDRLLPTHREFSSWRMGWFDHETEMEVDQPMGAVMLLPREVIDKVGLMDEKFWLLFNDVDWCRRIKMAGYKLLYYPKAVVAHAVGGSTGKKPYRLRAVSHLYFYRYLKKYARPHEYPLLWICGLILLLTLPLLNLIAFGRRRLTAYSSKSIFLT